MKTSEELKTIDAKDVLIFLNEWGKANAGRYSLGFKATNWAEPNRLWTVLTALRGPDDASIEPEKRTTTNHIRECVKELANSSAYTLDSFGERFIRPTREYFSELEEKSERFANHARKAFDALEQMGFGPDGWSE